MRKLSFFRRKYLEISLAHRKAVGGLWDEIGDLQLDYLIRNGLQPGHRLLDIGCGALRGGVRFIRYLAPGNYFGIDRSEDLLGAGLEIEIPKYGLVGKRPHLVCLTDFNFSALGEKFDYLIAHSVFTHLDWNHTLRCLVNVQKVLAIHGKFYATYFEDIDGSHTLDPIQHTIGYVTTYPDEDPYHYRFDVFEGLADRCGLKVQNLGDWGHPRDQRMLVFSQR